MRWALFIFGHYVNYLWNRLSAVPVPPDGAEVLFVGCCNIGLSMTDMIVVLVNLYTSVI